MDLVNGVDKNIIYREAMKQVADPNKVYKFTTSNLQEAFSFNNVAGEGKYSAAANCKAVLERYAGNEGVKSEGKRAKRAKRERQRGIKNRYWHVREMEEKLSDVKCATIKDFSDTCTLR